MQPKPTMDKVNQPGDDEILKKLIVVIKHLIPDMAVVQIHSETRIINELGIDSLKLAELSILLEDTFKRSFFLPAILSSVSDPYDLTVGSLVKFIRTALVEGVS